MKEIRPCISLMTNKKSGEKPSGRYYFCCWVIDKQTVNIAHRSSRKIFSFFLKFIFNSISILFDNYKDIFIVDKIMNSRKNKIKNLLEKKEEI